MLGDCLIDFDGIIIKVDIVPVQGKTFPFSAAHEVLEIIEAIVAVVFVLIYVSMKVENSS